MRLPNRESLGQRTIRRECTAHPLVRVVVRARSDADALEHALGRYVGLEARVETLGGAREPSEAEKLLDRGFNGLTIVMLGRDDERLRVLEGKYPFNYVFYVVPKAKPRNEHIHKLLEHYLKAKAVFRLSIGWLDEKRSYAIGGGRPLEGWEPNPRFDAYLATAGMRELAGRIFGVKPTLVLKRLEGEHYLYSGPRVVAKVKMSYEGLGVPFEKLSQAESDCASIEEQALLNREALEKLECGSVDFLKGLDADYVLVPWSGGKDSTAALLLARKAFGAKATPVFVDTGMEFDETLKHVDSVSQLLGVDPVRVRATVREALEAGASLPTVTDRWCTKLKVSAVQSLIREYARSGRVLVVVGDREAESPSRLERPAIIEHEDHVEAAPIKLWSAVHVQLYLALNKVPVNPLYEYGFFRIGCYMCPALRSWELNVMLRDGRLSYLQGKPFFRSFLDSRVKRQD
ncbi:phosphoadenosine phosphosulfate reductase family protein [Infirmifilum lucidum]|uniref:Phosphoadenosine phosphosulfate reductase family protein n=1 Tax=Infirmifilum lucidum TaxID=2776706 RepID=A0A7L9FG26_9CREN|nr:phosphoadenosine phosphosulfate reductase family protein [Infirmifilum lucidum]QOJ78768.1 phosphoadenosine phosphosulfate reductase family protein [Infirmifilum lucidum]